MYFAINHDYLVVVDMLSCISCVCRWSVPLFSLTASTEASWEDGQRGNHEEENMMAVNKLRRQQQHVMFSLSEAAATDC